MVGMVRSQPLTQLATSVEQQRLIEAHNQTAAWYRWGPYLSERQWGTVREDYSPSGTAWDFSSTSSTETYCTYLFSIAYRMLGSAMDAEDIVQETYLRYQATPPETIHSLKAYLTTILTRLCMDQLHLARKQREVYVTGDRTFSVLTIEVVAEHIQTIRVIANPEKLGRVE
jgi:hypothetical protein